MEPDRIRCHTTRQSSANDEASGHNDPLRQIARATFIVTTTLSQEEFSDVGSWNRLSSRATVLGITPSEFGSREVAGRRNDSEASPGSVEAEGGDL